MSVRKSETAPKPCPLDQWLAVEGRSTGQLSELSGVSKSSISTFRSRKRGLRPESIVALASATGISAEELLIWMANLPKTEVRRKAS